MSSSPNRPPGQSRHAALVPLGARVQLYAGLVVLAGATQTDDGEIATGSMFVVNVDSREQAEAFAKEDPFNSGGLFEKVVVTRMRKGHWHPENGDKA